MKNKTYLVAGYKPWNHRIFDEVISKYPGRWHFIEKREQLSLDAVRALNPRYIFFLHWSWKVPDEIIKEYECVAFHMTDLPFGRGGSPLQNLIARGIHETKISAIKVTEEFDAGPIYLQRNLCLHGSAEEIYIRATYKSADMIERIISQDLKPVPQRGKSTVFKRRRPEDSEIRSLHTVHQLYDFIRMVDAEGYPRAFCYYKGFRYELSRATLYDGRIEANVIITRQEDSSR